MTRISNKNGTEYLLISILFNRLLEQYVSQHHLNKANPVEQHKVDEIKRFAYQLPVSC